MLIAIWPLVAALVGLVVYVLATNGKVAEVGRILFMVGIFWLVAILAHGAPLRLP